VSNLARKNTEYGFYSLNCVYRDRLLTFSHKVYWKNI